MNDQKQQELAQVLDRQSFIGYQVQQRLLKSKVLIVSLTGSNTELAKNLILSGASVSIHDEAKVDSIDAECNFLFGRADIGESRGKLGTQRLIEINPLVDIVEQITLEDTDLLQFNIVSTATRSFAEMAQWDERCRKLNIPYYNFVCCGLYGFYYVSLGTSFAFEREKQVIRKLVMGQSLQQSEPEYREFEEVTASSVSLREALKLDHNSVVRTRNEIYYCILSNHHPTIAVMSRVQELPELNDFDPYDESAESIAKLDKIQAIGEQIYESAVGKKPSQQTSEMLRNFARLYGVEFCPVYSILGSVASQEFIVVISRTNEPGTNWFCYDRYIHPPCLVKLATGSLSLYKICVPSRNEISQNAGN